MIDLNITPLHKTDLGLYMVRERHQDSSSSITLGPNHPSKRSSERPKKNSNMAAKNARKGFWSEFLRSPLQTSREKPRRVMTGYRKERNGGQIHFLEKISFVLICKLPGVFLKRPCLKHAWSGV